MKITLLTDWQRRSSVLKAGEEVDVYLPTAKQMIADGLANEVVLISDRIELVALCDFKLKGKNYKEGEYFSLDVYFQKTANKLIQNSKAKLS